MEKYKKYKILTYQKDHGSYILGQLNNNRYRFLYIKNDITNEWTKLDFTTTISKRDLERDTKNGHKHLLNPISHEELFAIML